MPIEKLEVEETKQKPSVMERLKSAEDATEVSEIMRDDFLDTFSEETKKEYLKRAQEFYPVIEEKWRSLGHNPEWKNEGEFETNRTYNNPGNQDFYFRRDMVCKKCKWNYWIIVKESEIKVHDYPTRCTGDDKPQ